MLNGLTSSKGHKKVAEDMQTLTKALPLTLLLAAAPLWAQDTETPAEEAPAAEAPAAEDATESEAPSPEAGLNMGTPDGENEAGTNGETYVFSSHGDWELRCIRTGTDQPEPCQLYQLVKDQNGNSVAEFNMFALPPGAQAAAGANIVTPLETLLTEQISISVDGAQGKRYPFTFCTQIGCISRVGFTQADITGFKGGNSATITIVPAGAPDQKVPLSLSLTGFTAGYDALVAKNSGAAAN